ncbi:1-(5-phosphoribosyl)-5-[(5-phosphoribosylamino)methylideneamino]imidazole-4-carboxamide isomerase [Desulfatibacillum aliphaticivorans]|uniref:1-(5-phosphoribosyl)-5-[(5- phosphoribosylamino)methylideneamino]imidazole-4- carboxamide isomerase n=1 Tax=Desulfatibacillum aliphaticivorans TaxID=218208 RepID=UPI0003F702FF|nr:1-(5-phosphoribosyl)-5-[(5-phosphoribosylamino)methylideneamino]imidazole-4-carboxamide isomerase [Desulfatibacillum aliphaticivorans]
MIVIPAVDIRQGKCVRLSQGRADAQTVYSDDPAAMAAKWEGMGAARIHVVDLDGAFEKTPKNLGAIKKILETVKKPVQVGGGIRDLATMETYLDLGVSNIIIGTEAIRNPEMVKNACKRFPGKIIVGIDAKEGMVAVEGWTETTSVRAVDLARSFEDAGVAAINFTDIHRDGMQTGPNIEQTRAFAQAISIPVVASGGVSTIKDIKAVKTLAKDGVVGVITGRALYVGTLDLAEAVSAAMEGVDPDYNPF